MEDVTDYDGVIAEILTDAINAESDEPMVVVNWILMADVRLQDSSYNVAVKTPQGSPWWISEALVEQGMMAMSMSLSDDDE